MLTGLKFTFNRNTQQLSVVWFWFDWGKGRAFEYTLSRKTKQLSVLCFS